jgi:hypothetical protein
MPRKSRRTKINFTKRSSRRRTSTPNVYVESDEPSVDAAEGSPGSVLDASAATGAAVARDVRRQQRTEARGLRGRRGRQAPMRAAVYGQYLTAELRKLGAVTGVVAVALVVLTFTVG